MKKKCCESEALTWECWIKEYDSDDPDFAPGLWFSMECAGCGAMDFIPHAELDEGAVPAEVLARGLKWLKRQGE